MTGSEMSPADYAAVGGNAFGGEGGGGSDRQRRAVGAGQEAAAGPSPVKEERV